ncbi:RHS repeat-associated core domain-containing protein [Pseudomonas fulva]|nr:RHS repeat-associated core domain-containing protein [Pseudomonas fulva]MBF8695287.1 RHS repeat-associated core domain-containing protein [Pseudomonas fulva]
MPTFLHSTDRRHPVSDNGRPGHRAYSPYGAGGERSEPGLAFCGELRDPLTCSYPLGNGHRHYTPSLMRFHTPDTLSPFGNGGLNAYAYCVGDPVNHSDPTGQRAEEYVLPMLSILTNLMGVFISGLRFRSLRKQNNLASKTAVESLRPSVPKPELAEKVLTTISAVSGTGGFTVGVARMVDPDHEWQTWAIAALTIVSLGTSTYEAWRLAQAKPWRLNEPTLVNVPPLARSPRISGSVSRGRAQSEAPDSAGSMRAGAEIIRAT